MSKVFRHLKTYLIPILLSLLCLGVQAYCDLSLPQYMSDIVNVGIQQSGIDTTVPQYIKAEELEKIKLFAGEENASFITQKYKEATLNGTQVLELDTSITTEDYNRLDEIMKSPMIATYIIEQMSSGAESEFVPEDMGDMFSSLPEGVTFFDSLSMMDETQRAQIIASINENMAALDELGESTTNQIVVAYVGDVYKSAGVDTEKLQIDYIVKAGLMMLLYALVVTIASVVVVFLAAKVGSGFARDVRKELYEKVMAFSSKEVNHFGASSLITRSTNDIQQVMMLIIMSIRMVLYAPFVGIGAITKVMETGSGMTWVIVVAVVLILILLLVLMVIAMPRFTRLQKLIDKLNLVSREILTGVPVIRAFSREKFEEDRFDDANKDLYKTNLFVNRVMALMMPVMMFIMNGISVLIIWVGGHNIDAGSMQVGDLMAFIQYTMQIIMSFLMLSMISIMLPRAMVAVKRINEVLSTDISIKNPDTIVTFDDSKKGEVAFKNVSFTYPGADESVLKNIDFTAESGKTTAFIGSTGSGKSTLINLIPRFFDTTDGEITVDGADIKKVTLHDLREKIGYVPQKGMLFGGTIASNIGFDEKPISDEDMKWAAEIAQATEFIDEKPAGYQTEISQGGTNVSGGQRQRLSIARAIAKKPEILIFDDSFSALDFKTDATLRKALHNATAGTTVLIVAQRISTVMNADKIVVLDNGEVVGIGTHKELIKNCEVYNQIALSQLSKEEVG